MGKERIEVALTNRMVMIFEANNFSVDEEGLKVWDQDDKGTRVVFASPSPNWLYVRYLEKGKVAQPPD